MSKRVLEICPYEPPVSGWTTRVKLVRRVIRERGGTCDILDIGPSRMITGRDCMPVMHAWDYLQQVWAFARQGATVHGHINGEYFRGLLLTLAACILTRLWRNRCVVTFHAGTVQPFFESWRRRVIGPLFWLIFALSHIVICNSEATKAKLLTFNRRAKIVPVPAFSPQYLDYQEVKGEVALEWFLQNRSPLLLSYLCFREGFYTDVVIDAMAQLVQTWPQVGLVIVGTGDEEAAVRQQIAAQHIDAHVYVAGDRDHDGFLTLMGKSAVFLRSPISDGVSASVLEALALRTPVVASENGTRPPEVVTYHATDAHDLAQKLDWVLTHHDDVVASLPTLDIQDTAHTEVDLLFGMAPLKTSVT